jgi:hypothetical protein
MSPATQTVNPEPEQKHQDLQQASRLSIPGRPSDAQVEGHAKKA